MLPTEDLFVHVYVLVDDAIIDGVVAIPPRPGPVPACSDAEILTVALPVTCSPGAPRPAGWPRSADSAARPSLPLPLPLRPAKTTPVGWREDQEGAAFTRRKSRGRGDLTRGPLAAAPIGLMRSAWKSARSQTSVRAAAPV